MGGSEIVDLLANVSPHHVEQLDTEIAEQKDYLKGLVRARKLLGTLCKGAKAKPIKAPTPPQSASASAGGSAWPSDMYAKAAFALRARSPLALKDLAAAAGCPCNGGLAKKLQGGDGQGWFDKKVTGWFLTAKGLKESTPSGVTQPDASAPGGPWQVRRTDAEAAEDPLVGGWPTRGEAQKEAGRLNKTDGEDRHYVCHEDGKGGEEE